MMTRGILVEPFREKDAQPLCTFMEATFKAEGMRKGAVFDEGFWRWQYRDIPAGAALTMVAKDADRIIGHMAHLPVALNLESNEVRGVVTIDLMVEEEYRRQGVFRLLGEAANAVLEEQGVALSIAFPSRAESYAGFVKKLGWFVVGDLGIMAKPLFFRSRWQSPGIALERISRVPGEVNELWEKVQPRLGIAVCKSADYLNWRYFRKPGGNYAAFVVRRGEGIEGCFVLGLMTVSGMKVGLMVDLLCREDPEVMRTIVTKASNELLEAGARVCLIMRSRVYEGALRRLGFWGLPRALSPKNYTLIARWNAPGDPPEIIRDVYRWTLHFGDWDVV